MNIKNGVQQIGCHVVEGLVAQDTSVVDDDVNATVSIDGGLHNCGTAFRSGNRVVVGDGFSASGLDLINDYLCR